MPLSPLNTLSPPYISCKIHYSTALALAKQTRPQHENRPLDGQKAKSRDCRVNWTRILKEVADFLGLYYSTISVIATRAHETMKF